MFIKNFVTFLLNGRRKRRSILLLFDISCFLLIDTLYYFLALRAANSMPVDVFWSFLANSAVQLLLIIICRFAVGIYQNVWRYSNTRAYVNLVLADACSGVGTLVLIRFAHLFIPDIYRGVWHALSVGSMTDLPFFLYPAIQSRDPQSGFPAPEAGSYCRRGTSGYISGR